MMTEGVRMTVGMAMTKVVRRMTFCRNEGEADSAELASTTKLSPKNLPELRFYPPDAVLHPKRA